MIYGSLKTPILVALVTIALIGVIVGKIWRTRRRKPRPKSKQNRGPWAAGLAIGAVVVVLLSQPWMPSEQIATTSSGETFAGYVVGEQAGQLLLLDRSRKPVWIKVSDISGREVCEINWLPPDLRWIATPVFRAGGAPTPVECAKE